MFYKHLSPSAVDSQRSISTPPTTTDDMASSTGDAHDFNGLYHRRHFVEYLELKSEQSLGPGGMPIPLMQTAAPLDG